MQIISSHSHTLSRSSSSSSFGIGTPLLTKHIQPEKARGLCYFRNLRATAGLFYITCNGCVLTSGRAKPLGVNLTSGPAIRAAQDVQFK